MRSSIAFVSILIATALAGCKSSGPDAASSVLDSSEPLPACNADIACPEHAWADPHTCMAVGPGGVVSSNLTVTDAGNDCYAAVSLSTKICAEGDDPANYTLSCQQTGGGQAEERLPPCNADIACPQHAWADPHTCMAVGPGGTVSSTLTVTDAGNDCEASIALSTKVCAEGDDPSNYTLSCQLTGGDQGADNSLPGCNEDISCPENAWAEPHICMAVGPGDTVGGNLTVTDAGNECYAGAKLSAKICSMGNDPRDYQLSCRLR